MVLDEAVTLVGVVINCLAPNMFCKYTHGSESPITSTANFKLRSPMRICGALNEDPAHFFYICPLYAVSQESLADQIDLDSVDLHMLLYGDRSR